MLVPRKPYYAKLTVLRWLMSPVKFSYNIHCTINQSVNQQIRLPSYWLNRIQIKHYRKCKRFVYSWVNPKFQINRLQHTQNALARTIVQAPKFKHITLLFWNLFTGLKFPNELNIKSSLSLTKFSIPLSLRIYMTLYLFSLLTVTTHALHLMSLSSNHHYHSKSLIDPSDTVSYTHLTLPTKRIV